MPQFAYWLSLKSWFLTPSPKTEALGLVRLLRKVWFQLAVPRFFGLRHQEEGDSAPLAPVRGCPGGDQPGWGLSGEKQTLSTVEMRGKPGDRGEYETSSPPGAIQVFAGSADVGHQGKEPTRSPTGQ